jgi:NRAMP (natural resistance-associated macrophage protein)-like metal ion transporter
LKERAKGSLWRALGPGLITGAADDDPSGIATYSQTGAQFGYQLSWALWLTLPFLVAIQIVSACIGWSTNGGLARNIGKTLPAFVLLPLVALLVAANTINIAADLAAMGAAFNLVTGSNAAAAAIGFGIVCLIGEVFIPYHRYAGLLKYLTFVLFVYVAAAFSVHVPWGEVAHDVFLPSMALDRDMLLTIVAVFGTTISPYLFFWQASQEAEESRLSHRRHSGAGGMSKAAFRHIAVDTWAGMLVSHLVAFFIIVTTAATLHASGVTHIQTAQQAAEALRPVAGNLTFVLFSVGIIGTGMLAVPVLAGSAAYAVADAFHIRGSLEYPANRAIGFYAIVSAATLAGAALALSNLNPIYMLFWTAVVNGIVAVPIMFAMMLVASGKLRREGVIPRWVILLGWLGTAIMLVAVSALAWSSLPGP